MKRLTREQILKATEQPLPSVVRNVPELGGSVRLWTLTVEQRDAWEASRQVGKGRDKETNLRNIRSSLLVVCLRDDEGKRLFLDGDIPALGKLRADVADTLFAECCRLNGLEKKDVEDLAKNCETTPSDSSLSDSLASSESPTPTS